MESKAQGTVEATGATGAAQRAETEAISAEAQAEAEVAAEKARATALKNHHESARLEAEIMDDCKGYGAAMQKLRCGKLASIGGKLLRQAELKGWSRLELVSHWEMKLALEKAELNSRIFRQALHAHAQRLDANKLNVYERWRVCESESAADTLISDARLAKKLGVLDAWNSEKAKGHAAAVAKVDAEKERIAKAKERTPLQKALALVKAARTAVAGLESETDKAAALEAWNAPEQPEQPEQMEEKVAETAVA